VRILPLAVVCGLAAVSAAAQPRAPTAAPFDARAAIPTASGDTGLWSVPTAEVLLPREWSLSAHHVNADYDQGFTDVSNWPVTFGLGMDARVEVFAALTIVNRIDRDVRPLFFPGSAAGGVINDYPLVAAGWTGTHFGDLRAGAKLNVASQSRGSAAAMALRGLIKIPTADSDTGAGSGRADVEVDAIVSRELDERVELSAFSGFIVRGDPDGFDVSDSVRWGFGAGLPTRRHLRLTAEVHGEVYAGDTIANRSAIRIADGSTVPDRSARKNTVTAAIGLMWVGSNGLFAGGGVSWNLGAKARSELGPFGNETGDAIGLQVRVGYRRR
jgi:hypothetical protein